MERDVDKGEAYEGVMPQRGHGAEVGVPSQKETEEAMHDLLDTAGRYTVLISAAGVAAGYPAPSVEELWPGTGVLVKRNGLLGVVTAGHVLAGKRGQSRWNNRERSASIDIIMMRGRESNEESPAIVLSLKDRPCTVRGVDNEKPEGPDIGYIPLERSEMRRLELCGAVAYNLDRAKRQAKGTGQGVGIAVDGVVGVNLGMSLTLEQLRNRAGLAIIVTQTIELPHERREQNDWDYTEYDLKATKNGGEGIGLNQELIDNEAMARAFEERDKSLDQQKRWGGYSGAGLWSRWRVTDGEGETTEQALELKGISYYARSEETMAAHGRRSIMRITDAGREAHGRLAARTVEGR